MENKYGHGMFYNVTPGTGHLGSDTKSIDVVIPEDKSMTIITDVTDGVSLTNSMEEALAELFLNYRDMVDKPVLQDCGDEGIFRVHYKATLGPTKIRQGRFGRYQVTDLRWEYFAKDATALKVLYGKN